MHEDVFVEQEWISAADGVGATGAVCPGPPNSAGLVRADLFERTCSNKINSSVTFQSSFFKRFNLVSLFQLKSACSFALRFMRLMQTITIILLRSQLAKAPYVVLFVLKPLNRRRQLAGIYMYCVHIRKRGSGPPQNTLQIPSPPLKLVPPKRIFLDPLWKIWRKEISDY